MNVDLEACEEDQDTLKGKKDWKAMQICRSHCSVLIRTSGANMWMVLFNFNEETLFKKHFRFPPAKF